MDFISTENYDLEKSFVRLKGIFLNPSSHENSENNSYFSWSDVNDCNLTILKNLHECDDNNKYRKYVKVDAHFIQNETDNEAEISDC